MFLFNMYFYHTLFYFKLSSSKLEICRTPCSVVFWLAIK